MANPKINSKQAGGSLRATKRPKPDRRWTLLFIGNRGRTITLKRFKGMVLFALLILSVSIAIAAGIFLWNQKIIQEKYELESNLQTLKERLESLRYEKDLLMTRVVLAESRVQESLGSMPEKQSGEESTDQEKNDFEETKQPTQLAAKTIALQVKKQTEPKQNNNPLESGLSVAIENLKISVRSGNNTLRVQFKIKNTSPNSQHVAGHAIVVLKGDQIQQENWLSIPGMVLVDGKPTGKQRGYSFGISYFKTMRFTTRTPKFPEKYQTAAVYVYAHNGKLLLEQDFAVKLPAAERTASTPPSPDDLLKVLKNTSQ